jgi:predicted NUDIX family phosphoesterase/thymidylate kinase
MTAGDEPADAGEAMIARIEARAQKVLGSHPARPTTIQLSRRPFFVEFAGAPKAGKTTTLEHMDRILRRNGYRVRLVSERASTSPLRNKLDPLFNLWTAAATLSQIIESRDRDDHIVFIDRGIFDALCWMDWFHSQERLTAEEHESIDAFWSLVRIRQLIDLVFVLTVSPAEALERELLGLRTHRSGAIMNEETLEGLTRSIRRVVDRHGHQFACVEIDTTEGDEIADLERIGLITLGALERFLRAVLVVSRASVPYLPSTGFIPSASTIARFLDDVARHGHFVDRAEAEASPNGLQPIPIAYFSHGDRILLFHRNEKNPSHRLHDTFVVWAGGHVRRDDAGDDPIGDALAREIQEELFITTVIEPEVVGLVVDGSNPRSEMHVGVVHRVRLDDPGVAASMDRRNFVEPRGGSSMSSWLLGPNEVSRHWDRMDGWSRLIVRDHLGWS